MSLLAAAASQLAVSEWGTLEWLGAVVAVFAIIGGLVSFAGGIWWCSSAYSMLTTIRNEVVKTNGRVNSHDAIIVAHGERLMRLETQYDVDHDTR